MKRLIKKAQINLTEDNCFISLEDVINEYGLEKLKQETNNQLDAAWDIINRYKREVMERCKQEHPDFARYIDYDYDESGNADTTLTHILQKLGFEED